MNARITYTEYTATLQMLSFAFFLSLFFFRNSFIKVTKLPMPHIFHIKRPTTLNHKHWQKILLANFPTANTHFLFVKHTKTLNHIGCTAHKLTLNKCWCFFVCTAHNKIGRDCAKQSMNNSNEENLHHPISLCCCGDVSFHYYLLLLRCFTFFAFYPDCPILVHCKCKFIQMLVSMCECVLCRFKFF